tara:strand:- start:141 stop:377 length:237 start_codon:yes stop_codon:yes gene_type:complete
MMLVVMFVLRRVLESIKVKVHETLACFSDANVTRTMKALDNSFAASSSISDKGIGDVVVLIHGLAVVLGVVSDANGFV